MVIHSIKLLLRDKQAEGAPFKFEREIVGVNLGAVLEEADGMIKHWLSHGYTADDYLAMVSYGVSYRPDEPSNYSEIKLPALHECGVPTGFISRPEPDEVDIGEIGGKSVILRRLEENVEQSQRKYAGELFG